MLHNPFMASLVVGLGIVQGVRSQVETASIFIPPIVDSGASLQGEIAGSSADGTTYVLSYVPTSAGDTPFTLTLVENASHVSVHVFASDAMASASVELDADCGFGSSANVCTAVAEVGSGTNITTEIQTISAASEFTGTLTPVAVSKASAAASGFSSATSSTQSSSPSAPSTRSTSAATLNVAIEYGPVLSMFLGVVLNL
ncbi:hypothetical protein EW145_g1406 [Phellinidium pouzarii]|uniref:GPI anchored protein n=1 Tax=Phellinidium pouzarii TaxID=167371 RepID=A0A4V3XDM5_9AGAM|nr:hypothetical protein EW145_g1406 [Phellinidium pouzarii]